MKLFDYLFPLLLILSVLRQVRGRRLTWFQLAWPVGLVIWAALRYVHGFPVSGTNLVLVVAAMVTGSMLGIFAGVFTRIHRRGDGTLIARATAATVAAWVCGTIGRLVFGLYAEHGGGPAIAAFSHTHGISITAWAAALVLMAVCEVAGRTVVLGLRAFTAAGDRNVSPGGPAIIAAPHMRRSPLPPLRKGPEPGSGDDAYVPMVGGRGFGKFGPALDRPTNSGENITLR